MTESMAAATNPAGDAAQRAFGLIDEYQRTGQPELITAAIDSLRHALEQVAADDPVRGTYLSNLANALIINYENTAQLASLDEAVGLEREAIEGTPSGDPRVNGYKSLLGSALFTRFQRTGDIADLEQAVALLEQALAGSSPSDAYHGIYLSSLGNILLARFRRTGETADLDRAIALGRQALSESPTDDRARLQHESNLGEALLARAQVATESGDTITAADTINEVLHLVDPVQGSTPDGSRALILRASAMRMLGRFEEAESTLRQVLAAEPENAQAASELSEVLRLAGKKDKLSSASSSATAQNAARVIDEEGLRASDASESVVRESEISDREGTAVSWRSDAPASRDMLNRDALAALLADRLTDIHDTDDEVSFLVHVDGSWGTGKSTLLNFLEEKLAKRFLAVRLDAWQQSGIGPPWWTLLTTTRNAIVAECGWWGKRRLRISETLARIRQTGATFSLALLMLVVIIAVIAYVLWPHKSTMASWSAVAQSITAIAAAIALFWAGSRVAARFLLWDSAGGARLFEKSGISPMQQVMNQFSWLIDRSPRPVIIFVDNLDRCDGAYVVSLLDSIQTIVRDARVPGGSAAKKHQAAMFLVAADGTWLRTSYECAYRDFQETVSRPGRPLGYLFLDKIFQLTVPMPAVPKATRQALLDSLLLDEIGGSANDTRIAAARGDIERARGDSDRIRHVLRILPKDLRREVSGDAAQALSAKDARRHTEHRLQKFASLLDGNPRTIKRFINTFTIIEAIRTLEAEDIDFDSLALWSIVRVRWPEMADYLEKEPGTISDILSASDSTNAFPKNLQSAAVLGDLRRVVEHTQGGPLTPELVRRCSGNFGD